MKIIVSILLISAMMGQIYGQATDSVSNRLTQALTDLHKRGHISGYGVAIVDAHGIQYAKGIGYADKKNGQTYTVHTVQNVASVSKTLIGIALLKAVELGKLQLDDPVNQYLPLEVHNPYFPAEVITIRQLATHTSSIRDPARYEQSGYVRKEVNPLGAKSNGNFRKPSSMMSVSAFLKDILDVDGQWYKKRNFLKKPPGAQFEYSNLGAGLAAMVIEGATGSSYIEFTTTHILRPLKMQDSGWSFESIDFAAHTKLYLDVDTELAHYRLVNYPDGGLLTSVTDMGLYLSELIKGFEGHGILLSAASYRELFQPQLNDSHYKERSDNAYNDEYNMGVFMGCSAQGYFGHTGGDPGVATYMFFNSATKVGKFLMVNTQMDKEGGAQFYDIWKALEAAEGKF